MLIDLRTLDDQKPISANVLIIGAGPAGITLALELEKSGKSVALLESGGFEMDAATQDFYNGKLLGDQKSGVLYTRLRYLGGSSNHWGGHCLPLEPIDVEQKDFIPDSGWPFGVETLESYYKRAQDYTDTGAYDYGVDKAYASKFGSLMPIDPEKFLTVKMRQSKPTRFGTKYQSRLEQSKNITLYTWANVTDIVPNAEGSRIDAVKIQTKTGKSFTATADVVVLATGGIENARVMLNARHLSDSGLANPYGIVGAYFMDHPSTGLGFLHPAKPLDVGLYTGAVPTPDGVPSHYTMRPSDKLIRENGLVNATLWLTPLSADEATRKREDRAKRAMEALRNMRHHPGQMFHAQDDGSDACNALEGVDALAMNIVRKHLGSNRMTTDRLLIRAEAEQMPDTTNRVKLIADKDALGLNRISLNWEPSKSTIEALRKVALLFGTECARTGIGRFELERNFEAPYANTSTAWHHMGTTRMGNIPTKSVVDPDLKVHGINNMYVAGSSVFPTSGRSNPTLTIVALSIRLADRLQKMGV